LYCRGKLSEKFKLTDNPLTIKEKQVVGLYRTLVFKKISGGKFVCKNRLTLVKKNWDIYELGTYVHPDVKKIGYIQKIVRTTPIVKKYELVRWLVNHIFYFVELDPRKQFPLTWEDSKLCQGYMFVRLTHIGGLVHQMQIVELTQTKLDILCYCGKIYKLIRSDEENIRIRIKKRYREVDIDMLINCRCG